jgi:hypothetical protein
MLGAKVCFVANLHKAFAPIFATILLGFSSFCFEREQNNDSGEKRKAKSPAKIQNVQNITLLLFLSKTKGTYTY